MLAVVVSGPNELALERVHDPSPGPGEVVVRVGACGVCGTDLHLVDGHLEAVSFPIVPGHELAGEVVGVGHDVLSPVVGDRVAVDPSLPCGHCGYCASGRSNLCEPWRAIGISRSGGCAELVAVPAVRCFTLPPELSYSAASLIEPIACAVHGIDRLPRRLGEHYLIYGAGTMGLALLQLARRNGASSVSVVDLDPDRRAFAATLGADAVAASGEELGRPDGFEVVIDATGVIAAIERGLRLVRKGGTFLQFGVAPTEAVARFSPFRIYAAEVDVIGSMAVLDSFDRAVQLVAEGAIDAEAMITHRLALESYPSALQLLRDHVGRKIQIVPDPALDRA
jgi:2-desacetyl-2-hydroxyethyl bacteriochlorophyllide A dehydrogenase